MIVAVIDIIVGLGLWILLELARNSSYIDSIANLVLSILVLINGVQFIITSLNIKKLKNKDNKADK